MPRPEDIHIGQRLRERRKALDMTQQELAAATGVKFQQIQKYETGANRISGSRLVDMARALSVEVGFFFAGLDTPAPADEVKSSDEASLLVFFRASPEAAQKSILRIAETTAQVSA